MKEVTHFLVLGQDEDRKPFSFAINAERLDRDLIGVFVAVKKEQDRFDEQLYAWLRHLGGVVLFLGNLVKSADPGRLDGEVLTRIGAAAEKLGSEIDNLSFRSSGDG